MAGVACFSANRPFLEEGTRGYGQAAQRRETESAGESGGGEQQPQKQEAGRIGRT